MEEKKVYARAPEGCCDYLTAGYLYPAEDQGDGRFYYRNPRTDGGKEEGFPNYACWEGCPHLNGGNWERLVLTEAEAEKSNANLRDALDSHPDSEPDADQYTVGSDTMTEHDTVNAPSHYASGEIECIDAIRAQMTAEQFAGYLRGNVAKYLWRYEHKGGVESLRKAEWYLRRLIDVVE